MRGLSFPSSALERRCGKLCLPSGLGIGGVTGSGASRRAFPSSAWERGGERIRAGALNFLSCPRVRFPGAPDRRSNAGRGKRESRADGPMGLGGEFALQPLYGLPILILSTRQVLLA